MSFKASDQRKNKNFNNNMYPNSLLNNHPKNSKLSFTNALKNNTQKQKYPNVNNNKKIRSKGNNLDYQENNEKNNPKNIYFENKSNESEEEDLKEEGMNNPINKDQEINMENIIIDEEIPQNKKLNNVDSFKNIEFLLPKKNNLNENTNNKKKKEIEDI